MKNNKLHTLFGYRIGSRIAVAIALAATPYALLAQSSLDIEATIKKQAKALVGLNGVSFDEAVRRSQLQQRIAEQTDIYARDPNYAGAWIKRSSTDFAVFYAFKGGNVPSEIADADLKSVTTIINAPVSMKEFEVERERIGGLLSAAGISVSVTYNDEKNQLVMSSNKLTLINPLIATKQLIIPQWVQFDDQQFFAFEEASISGEVRF